MATGSSEVASPNTELGKKDLVVLLEVLYPARNKYCFFGLQIGLGIDEIESIESNKTDSGKRLLAILSVRLNKAKPLTWNEIYSALRSKTVDESRLAEEIRRKYGHLFISTEREYEVEHEIKSKEILQVKKSAPKTQKGGDHRARVSKERERSSEYEGIETVRSKKHVQEVESEDEEDSVLSRKKKELSKKGKRKGGKPAHDREKVHGKERAKRMNKKEKFMKDESHSEPEEVREVSKQKKKATHDREESVNDHDHHSDSEVCRKRVKKGSRRREVSIESESEASSDEEEMQCSSLEDDTSHKESAKTKPVTKHTEMKVKVQKEHRDDRKDKKYAKSQYSDEEVSTKSAQKLRRSKKFETESDQESSSASSSDEEEIEVTDISKHTETKYAAHSKDTTHYESEEKGKISGKKRVSLKPQSATAVSPCPELYKDKRRKKTVKVGKSIDYSKETYHKTSSKPPRNQREDQEEGREVVSGKKGTAPPLERDLPSSEMAETDSGGGESDESSEDEEQKSSDEEEETEYYDCSPAEEEEEKGKIMSRHIKEKDQEEKKEVVSAKKETPPCLERDLPSSEMAETDSGDGESDESSEYEKESEQKSSDEEEETENDDSSSVEEKEKKGSEKSRKSEQKASISTTTTEMRKTKSQNDDDDNSKQKKSSKALSKDDSHGDKEGSYPGGSRDQEDQPKKRNRRRHRERSKTPIVRGDSSPSSSQEERKKRGRDHKKKSDRKKKGKGDKDGASGTDDSSPECDMVNQSEVEKKELVSVFECFYGQLCCVEFNPKEIVAQLQKKGLISIPLMKELIVSPESQQAKIITLIDALYEMIKSHPEHLFSCIEVMFKNDGLQEAGRELLTEAGKNKNL